MEQDGVGGASGLAGANPGPLGVPQFLDRPLGRYRITVFILCGLIMALEGFDMYMIGSIVPIIAQGFSIEPAAVGQVFVAQAVGLAIGYGLVSPLADKFGRRTIILVCVAGFAGATLLGALAGSITTLAATRFVAFVFFGGVVPNTIALVTELSSTALRQRTVVLMNAVFAVGSSSGVIAAPLITGHWGWQGVFWVAGIGPLLLLPALLLVVPESPRYLVLRAASTERLRRVLRRIASDPAVERARSFATDEPPASKTPLAELFVPERIRTTLLLVVMGSAISVMTNLVPSWMPTYLQVLAGFSAERAAAVMAASSLGAIMWPFAMVLLMRRLGLKRTVALSYCCGALSLALFAVQPLGLVPALLMSLGFGAFVIGVIGGVYAMTSTYYPTAMRSTALGFTAGLARVLAISGPALGGVMLSSQFSQQAIALVLVTTLLIGLVATLALKVAPDTQH